MIQALKHLSVNWVDGMKISQRHFVAQENHFADALRDVASYPATNFNYGLLPTKNVEAAQNIFDIYNSATNDVQLIIRKCNAVTPAGYRIAIDELKINVSAMPSANSAAGAKQDDTTEQQYFILVSVNPFDKIPAGDFDPEETPPRHISTEPKYHVELVLANTGAREHLGGNYIIAGRILSKGGLVSADASFIPPCTSLHSHPVLLKYYNAFARIIASLQQFAIRIIQKNSFKNQNSVLATNIKQLCTVVLGQFANCYFYYRNVVHQMPPVYMIDVFSKLAYSLYNTIETLQPKEKEEMLNYFYEWSDVSPHVLLNQLSYVVEINYDHHKNGEYLININQFLQNLYNIWEKLSGLEYIGQHKENIVVQEQAVTQIVKDKKGWSVLD